MPDPVEHKYFDHAANCYKTESLQMRPIKIWGLRNLNRAYHLDRVYVKFVNWIEWGTAGNKLISNIDFNEPHKVQEFGQHHMRTFIEDQRANSGDKFDEFKLAKDFKLEKIKTNESFEIY